MWQPNQALWEKLFYFIQVPADETQNTSENAIIWFSLVVLSLSEGFPSLGFQSQAHIFLCPMTGNKYVHFHSFCEGQSFVFVKKVHLFWRADLRWHVWWRFELVVELEGECMFTVVSTCTCMIRLEQIPPDKPCQMTHSKFYWQVVFYSGQ